MTRLLSIASKSEPENTRLAARVNIRRRRILSRLGTVSVPCVLPCTSGLALRRMTPRQPRRAPRKTLACNTPGREVGPRRLVSCRLRRVPRISAGGLGESSNQDSLAKLFLCLNSTTSGTAFARRCIRWFEGLGFLRLPQFHKPDRRSPM